MKKLIAAVEYAKLTCPKGEERRSVVHRLLNFAIFAKSTVTKHTL